MGQLADSGPEQVQHRRKRGPLHPDKSYCGKVIRKQKDKRRPNKKAEFEFMMDSKTLIARTAIDPELTRVRISMRREDREATPEGYKPVFGKLSIRWGIIFMDDQIVVPVDLRRRLLDILHFGHAGLKKMTAEAKIFWWPNITRDREYLRIRPKTAPPASLQVKI